MQEYPSNSNEVRKLRPVEPDEKPPVKVIEGKAIRRKPTLSKRLREMFFAEVDERKGIVDYVVGDIMVPALKDMIMDSFQEGMQRTFYGSSRPRRSSSRSSGIGTTHTNYSRYSSSSRNERPTPIRRSRSSRDFEDIILETRADAERTLDTLRENIKRYEFTTVRELYECIGEPSTPVDEKWGWADLNDAVVRRLSSGGYLLDFPTPEPIET